jgi:hypothetical protein
VGLREALPSDGQGSDPVETSTAGLQPYEYETLRSSLCLGETPSASEMLQAGNTIDVIGIAILSTGILALLMFLAKGTDERLGREL